MVFYDFLVVRTPLAGSRRQCHGHRPTRHYTGYHPWSALALVASHFAWILGPKWPPYTRWLIVHRRWHLFCRRPSHRRDSKVTTDRSPPTSTTFVAGISVGDLFTNLRPPPFETDSRRLELQSPTLYNQRRQIYRLGPSPIGHWPPSSPPVLVRFRPEFRLVAAAIAVADMFTVTVAIISDHRLALGRHRSLGPTRRRNHHQRASSRADSSHLRRPFGSPPMPSVRPLWFLDPCRRPPCRRAGSSLWRTAGARALSGGRIGHGHGLSDPTWTIYPTNLDRDGSTWIRPFRLGIQLFLNSSRYNSQYQTVLSRLVT